MKTPILFVFAVLITFGLIVFDCKALPNRNIVQEKDQQDSMRSVAVQMMGRNGRVFGIFGLLGKALNDRRKNFSLNFGIKSNFTLFQPYPVFLYPMGGGMMPPMKPSVKPPDDKPTKPPPDDDDDNPPDEELVAEDSLKNLSRAERLKRKTLTRASEDNSEDMKIIERNDDINDNDDDVLSVTTATTTVEPIMQTTNYPSIGTLPLEENHIPPTKPVTPQTITGAHHHYGQSQHQDINSISFTTSHPDIVPNTYNPYAFKPSPTDQVYNFRPSFFQPTQLYQNFI